MYQIGSLFGDYERPVVCGWPQRPRPRPRMFPCGTQAVAQEGSRGQNHERRLVSLLCSCFSDQELKKRILAALPDAADAPPPMLPPWWEQRLDQASGSIFYVDHSTTTTTWSDPRTSSRHPSKATDDGEEGDEVERAAADLTTLMAGVAPSRLSQWCGALEQYAQEALRMALSGRRDLADEQQFPRYMLLQQLHHAVLRRFLVQSAQLQRVEALLERRAHAITKEPKAGTFSLDAKANLHVFTALSKHAAAGLTNSYQARPFGAKKLNLHKVHKTLLGALPLESQLLPESTPRLPGRLSEQLLHLLLEPRANNSNSNSNSRELEPWRLAADATLALGLCTGSLFFVLQLPRAVYCRGIVVADNLSCAPVLYQLQRRCAPTERKACSWQGFAYWVSKAGVETPRRAPLETDGVSAEDASVQALVASATLASVAWEAIAAGEGIPLVDASMESGSLPLRSVVPLTHALLAMGLGGDAHSARTPTAQLIHEMRQPLAIELRAETIKCLASLLLALLSPEHGARRLVSAVCTLRLATVHLLLFERCGVDTTAMLLPPPTAAGEAAKGALASLLLERLFDVLFVSPREVSAPLRELWGRVQLEAILTLVSGLGTLLPLRHAHFALLFACLQRQHDMQGTRRSSSALGECINALMLRLAAAPGVSLLAAAGDDFSAPPSPEVLGAALPPLLRPETLEFESIQERLRRWLVKQTIHEATAALADTTAGGAESPGGSRGGDTPAAAASPGGRGGGGGVASPGGRGVGSGGGGGGGGVTRSCCLKLLASVMHELLGRASLCSQYNQDARNGVLMRMAEELLAGATELLQQLPTPADAAELSTLDRRLSQSFVGSLLPWLVDALNLFSAFAFEHAWRLLPTLLPLLNALKRITGGGGSGDLGAATAESTWAEAPFESAHPYGTPTSATSRRNKVQGPDRISHVESKTWTGATQLLLRFDGRCRIAEGDSLVLSFYKNGKFVQTLRYEESGGPLEQWPDAPVAVAADGFRLEFSHVPQSRAAVERWGYGLSVRASRLERASALATPPLVQLQRSLAYLGAKCASLLVSAEPVLEGEKEHRHWLHSPLFGRGLPLQLPAEHPLMHPFFGIKSSLEGEGGASGASPAAKFLNQLAGLDEVDATAAEALHEFMLSSTPELSQPRPHFEGAAAAEREYLELAERALLAALLSYNGHVADARRAAAELLERRSGRRSSGSSRVAGSRA